jgi:membrane protein
MDHISQRVERWLWRPHGRPLDDPPRWLRAARYSYALLRDFLRGDLSLRAMSLVYTTIIAIVPLLAFSFSVLKGLGFHRDLAPLLRNFLAPLGDLRAEEITQQVVGFVDNVSGSALASIAIVVLLYSALSMAQKVECSFNFIWRVDRPRSFVRRFSEYLSVMLVGPLLMSVAFSFLATLSSTRFVERLRAFEPLGAWLVELGSLTPYALVIAAFTFLYIFVPNTRVLVKPAVLGGLFAGVLWAGGGSLFTTFVASASRTETIYAGFAIVIVTMLWLYWSWLILLLGAQLSFYSQNPEYLRLGQRAETSSHGLRERLALSAMLLVGRDFESPGHGWRVESLAARMRVPRQALDPVVTALVHCGLLTRTPEHRLIPARDPRRIAVIDILDAVRSGAPDTIAAQDTDWSPTIRTLADQLDHAIRAAVAGKSLADLVDADCASEAAEPSAPRAISRR